MRTSAALVAAGLLATCLAAAGAAHADMTLGGMAANAAKDGMCVKAAKTVNGTTGHTHEDPPEETDCPDGVAPGSVIYETATDYPPTQQKPSAEDPFGLGTTTTTTTVQGQPPLVNPYTTTVVKPKPKTTSSTTPKH